MNLDKKTIGFIGGGNMAKAIINGILQKNLLRVSQIIISSPSESTLEYWRKLSINAVHSNAEVLRKADIIILAFKPYQLDTVISSVNEIPHDLTDKLVISILAGVSNDTLFKKFKNTALGVARLIRVMPNTPVMVCAGSSAISAHSSATPNDVHLVQKIFEAVGKTVVLDEHLMPAITGLVGSGPAYIYTIIEALSDGAVKQGLPRNIATTLAAQMVLGSAKMVLDTEKHPGQLKDDVCSSGGTTIYAIHALEKSGVRAALMNAVEAATLRGQEIASLIKE